ADPRNLTRIQPRWARPRWIVEPPRRLAVGALLDFRVSGLPGVWRVIVRGFDPPYRFVDAQVRGPFARWEHRHRFVEGPAGDEAGALAGTWGEDRGTYRPPLGGPGPPARAAVRTRGRAVPRSAGARLAGPAQAAAAGNWTPRAASRGRTRSVSSPMRARLFTIEECMSRLKYFR